MREEFVPQPTQGGWSAVFGLLNLLLLKVMCYFPYG